MNHPVPDQEARILAIESLHRHVFLSAGAGTGKTSVLVGRYIQALAQPDSHVASILAVTFTEKAAAEMKTRVRDACRERVRQASRAGEQERWAAHLGEMEHAPISTIHGLCASILREFPLQAGVDPRFGVLDGEEGPMLLAECAREAGLAGLDGDEPDPMAALTSLWGFPAALFEVARWVERREVWLPGGGGIPGARSQYLERWWAEVDREVTGFIRSHRVQEAAGFLLGLDEAELPAGGDPLSEAVRVLRALVRPWMSPGEARPRTLLGGIAGAAGAKASGKGTKKAWAGSAHDLEEVRRARKMLVDEARAFFGTPGKSDGARAWSADAEESAATHSWAFAREMVRAAELYQARKQEALVLDFEDLLIRTRDLLRDHERVRMQVAARYRHLMIDEFQDTNGLQKELLWYVAGAEPLEGPWRFEPVPDAGCSLFVIGDAKQSIYRFRHADVSVFNETREQFEGERDRCLVLELTRNFRSGRDLIDVFFNPLFLSPALMGPRSEENALSRLYRARYSALSSDRPSPPGTLPVALDIVRVPAEAGENEGGGGDRTDDGGGEICADGAAGAAGADGGASAVAGADDGAGEPAGAGANRGATGEPREPPEPEPSTDLHGCRILEADLLARAIRGLLAGAVLVEEKRGDGTRAVPARPGHIGILLRAMTDVAVYEAALRAHGVPFYNVGGKGFYGRQEIRDVLSFLRYLCDEQDSLSLAGALRSPFAAISDETLFRLARRGVLAAAARLAWDEETACAATRPGSGEMSHVADDEWARLATFMGIASGLRRRMRRLPVGELVEEMLRRTGYPAALAANGGAQEVANLEKLVERARKFSRRALSASAEGFCDHLAGMAESADAEPQAPTHGEEDDVVTLSTVHRAKGLEWPIVFLPDLGRSRHAQREPVLWRPGFGLVGPGLGVGGRAASRSLLSVGPRACEDEQEEFEDVRVFYVACTRARDRLFLSASTSVRKDGTPSGRSWLSRLWTDVLAAEGGPGAHGIAGVLGFPGAWGSVGALSVRWFDPDRMESPEIPSGSVEDEPERLDLEALTASAPPSAELCACLMPIEAPPEPPVEGITGLAAYVHCPKRFELEHRCVAPAAAGPVGPATREKGILVHAALQRLVRAPGEAVLPLVAGCFTELGFGASRHKTLVEETAALLETFKRSDLYRDIRAATAVRSEMSVMARVGRGYVTGRVDLLFRDAGGEWALIDFKTGRARKEMEPYRLQLAIYAWIVQDILGGERLRRAELHYLETSSMVALRLPTDAANARRDVERALEGIASGAFEPQPGPRCEGCKYERICRPA